MVHFLTLGPLHQPTGFLFTRGISGTYVPKGRATLKIRIIFYLKHKLLFLQEKYYKCINSCFKPSIRHVVVVTGLSILYGLFINNVRLDDP